MTIDLEHFRRASTTSSNAMDALRNRTVGKTPQQIHDEALRNIKETTAHLAGAKESTALSIANSKTVNGKEMVSEWCKEMIEAVQSTANAPSIIGLKMLIRTIEAKLDEGKVALAALAESNRK